MLNNTIQKYLKKNVELINCFVHQLIFFDNTNEQETSHGSQRVHHLQIVKF